MMSVGRSSVAEKETMLLSAVRARKVARARVWYPRFEVGGSTAARSWEATPPNGSSSSFSSVDV